MSDAEELAFIVRHILALGDRGSGWNALYTLRISLPSTLSFPLSSSLSLYRRMCARASNASMCAASLYAYMYVCVYILYMYIYVDSAISLFLSFSLRTFVPLLPQEQWIMLFRFTYMCVRPSPVLDTGDARCQRYHATFWHRFANFSYWLMFIR